MNNFWQKMNKGFSVLAPMSGVTDFPFREVVCEIGKPDVIFTEFVSVEMLSRGYLGTENIECIEVGSAGVPPVPTSGGQNIPYVLHFSEKQRPIVVQFFGSKPEQFEKCAALAVKLGFDGIDINMGCPDKKVLKQCAGSDLIKNPKLAKEIIRATIAGCGGKLPVSVKTRLGYGKNDNENWVLDIVEENISAITIHGRTATQGYGGVADWEKIGKMGKEIREKLKKLNREIIIIGNGDVKDIGSGAKLCVEYGLDGFMIGRQILKNPWVFNDYESPQIERQISRNNAKERIRVALKHTKLFQKFYKVGSGDPTLTKKINIGAMKKYYKAYLAGMEVKKELMEAKSFEEAEKLLK